MDKIKISNCIPTTILDETIWTSSDYTATVQEDLKSHNLTSTEAVRRLIKVTLEAAGYET